MSQQSYIEKLITRFKVNQNSTVNTPLPFNFEYDPMEFEDLS
jgi:hypothetical protein